MATLRAPSDTLLLLGMPAPRGEALDLERQLVQRRCDDVPVRIGGAAIKLISGGIAIKLISGGAAIKLIRGGIAIKLISGGAAIKLISGGTERDARFGESSDVNRAIQHGSAYVANPRSIRQAGAGALVTTCGSADRDRAAARVDRSLWITVN